MLVVSYQTVYLKYYYPVEFIYAYDVCNRNA